MLLRPRYKVSSAASRVLHVRVPVSIATTNAGLLRTSTNVRDHAAYGIDEAESNETVLERRIKDVFLVSHKLPKF